MFLRSLLKLFILNSKVSYTFNIKRRKYSRGKTENIGMSKSEIIRSNIRPEIIRSDL